jgi:hypothetical protein
VSVDNQPIGDTEIVGPETDFHREFRLPDSVVGRQAVEVELRVSPVEQKDGYEYGAVFGKIAIRAR